MLKFDPQWQSTALTSGNSIPKHSAKQHTIGVDLATECEKWLERIRGLHQQYLDPPEADQHAFATLCEGFKTRMLYQHPNLSGEQKDTLIRKFLTTGHAFVDTLIKEPDAHEDLKVNFMVQIETQFDACVPGTHNFLINATNTLHKLEQADDDSSNLLNTFKDQVIENYLKQYFHNKEQADMPPDYFGHLPAWLAQQIYPRDIQENCTIDFLESRVNAMVDPSQHNINYFLKDRPNNRALLATMQSEQTGQACATSTLTETLQSLDANSQHHYVSTIVAGHLSHYLSQNLTTSHFLEFMVETIESKLISLSVDAQVSERFEKAWLKIMPELTAPMTAYNDAPGSLEPVKNALYKMLPALEHKHLGSKTITGYANGNELLTFDEDTYQLSLNKTALKSAWHQQMILNTFTQYGIHPEDVVAGQAAILPLPEHPPAQPSSGESKQASDETSPPPWAPLDHLNQTALKDALARACPMLIRAIEVTDKASPASTQAVAGGESKENAQPPDHAESKAVPQRNQPSTAPEALVVPIENQQQLYDWLQSSVQLWSNDALAAVCAKHLIAQQSPLINPDLFPLAVQSGLTATVRVCLTDDSMCPDPDRPLLQGRTPLMWACANGHLDIAKMLAKNQANLSAKTEPDGNTMMHFAAMNGHTTIVKWLLEMPKKVPPNALNQHGHGPLYLAGQAGHAATVKTLCQYNPTVDQLKSAMKIAAEGQHTSCEKIILKTLFEDLKNEEQVQYLDKVTNKWQDPDLTWQFFQTLAQKTIKKAQDIAEKKGHQQMVSALRQAQADVNVSGLQQHRMPQDIINPIFWMAIEADDATLIEALSPVMRYALNLNLLHPLERKRPLLYALEHNKLNAIAWLDAEQISLQEGPQRDTALTWAARHNNSELLHKLLRMNVWANKRNGENNAALILLRMNIWVNKRNGENNTALMVALRKGHYTLATALLQAGANPNHRNHDGVSALHIAAKDGDHQIVSALIQAGVNCNARILAPVTDDTALQIATRSGNHQMVSALLQAGADANTPNAQGHRPFRIALDNQKHLCAKTLLEGMCRIGEPRNRVPSIIQYLDATADAETVISLIKAHFTTPIRIPWNWRDEGIYEKMNAYQILVSDPVNYQRNRARVVRSSSGIIRFFRWLYYWLLTNEDSEHVLSPHDDPILQYLDRHHTPQQGLQQAAFQHRVQPTRAQTLSNILNAKELAYDEDDDYSSSPWDPPGGDLGPRISLSNRAYDS